MRTVNLLSDMLLLGLEVVYMVAVIVSCWTYINSPHVPTTVLQPEALIEVYKKGASDGINAMIELQKKEVAKHRET